MQSFGDWLDFHGLDSGVVQKVIAARRGGQLHDAPDLHAVGLSQSVREHGDIGTRPEALSDIVIPALATFLGEGTDVRGLLHRVDFTEPADTENVAPPYTADLGKGQAPRVEMAWHGTFDDVNCLAHEAAHALQILLSKHETMPPVARETCAFLGELAVIEHARNRRPELFGALCEVWRKENEAYLGRDLDALSRAVADLATPYHYRQNYLIARLVAVEMFRRGPGTWWRDLFSAGSEAMQHLPIQAMAERAADETNPLPPLPEPDAENPVIDAYRSLGAIVMLDLVEAGPSAQMPMGSYYNAILERMRERQVFIALDEARRPAGYATWTSTADDANGIRFDRLVAPYGDCESLRESARQYAMKAVDTGKCELPSAENGERDIDHYAAIGYALEILAASGYQRRFPLDRYIGVEILPPLRCRQVRFYLTEAGIPTAMVTWAWISETIEREIHETGRALQHDEWDCGDRLFINDLIAPYGGTRQVVRDLRDRVFPELDHGSIIRRNPDGSLRRVGRFTRKGRPVNSERKTA